MDELDLVATIRSLGAFIPEKFYKLWSEESIPIAVEVFREYVQDISLSTGALYFAMRLPVKEPWADLVKQHFENLRTLEPSTATEMNNKAFAYHTFGFYRDPSLNPNPPEQGGLLRLIVTPFKINGFRGVQPIYEEAIRKDPKLWEPRYNLAQGLTGLANWAEHPEQDCLDEERALEELTKILEIDPKNIPARLRLATRFYLYGVNSVGLLQEVLGIDPNNEEAKRELERFRPSKVYFAVSPN